VEFINRGGTAAHGSGGLFGPAEVTVDQEQPQRGREILGRVEAADPAEVVPEVGAADERVLPPPEPAENLACGFDPRIPADGAGDLGGVGEEIFREGDAAVHALGMKERFGGFLVRLAQQVQDEGEPRGPAA
jgi:hypothetical protein